MKQIKLGNILENAARLAGRQVDQLGVPENWKALAALAIGEGIRRLAAEKFPMMQRVEFRRYRPTWTRNVGWLQGHECWYGDGYWHLEAIESSGAPGSAGSGWTRLDETQVVAFVDFAQPWENTVIDRGSVDVNRFAYVSDPKTNPNAAPAKAVGMTDFGVMLQAPAPKGVFVKFVPKYPNVSFVSWAATASYESGDVVYLSATRDCYQCLADVAANASNDSPDVDTANWQAVRVSDVFENFLTRTASVDMLTEDQGKYQAKAAADREFDELCARYHEGAGENRVRTGRFR